MTEECSLCLEMAQENMANTVDHLEKNFQKIRAGKADPAMLDSIKIDNYGVLSPLNQVAGVNTPDPRTLVVQPWDKSMLEPIEKAILGANLGFNPQNDGTIIRINIPVLTEERRLDLVKKVRSETENAKISIRNARRIANEEAKGFKDDGVPEDEIKKLEAEIQKLTDTHVALVDTVTDAKEKDIMKI